MGDVPDDGGVLSKDPRRRPVDGAAVAKALREISGSVLDPTSTAQRRLIPEIGALALIKAEAHKWLGNNTEAKLSAVQSTALLPRGTPRWLASVAVRSSQIGDSRWRASFLRDVPDNARIMDLSRVWLGTVS